MIIRAFASSQVVNSNISLEVFLFDYVEEELE